MRSTKVKSELPKLWVCNLLRSSSFPHSAARLELLQTHISWIILAGDYAYKIKKPVTLEFLDYSTLEKRKTICQKEIVLNRRFAPQLYISVVPITGTKENPVVEGDGITIEYAVKMHRFADNELVARMAKDGTITPKIARRLAATVASLHQHLPPYKASSSLGTPNAFFRVLTQNIEQLESFGLPPFHHNRIKIVSEWLQSQFDNLFPFMEARLASGRVKDCHGNCHLGNIIVHRDKVILFDCLEFNDEFRIMDTIAEAAFLWMDMRIRKLASLSHSFINDYLEYSGDYEGLRLLKMYACHYAMVRAKVCLIQKAESGSALNRSSLSKQFSPYVDVAINYALTSSPKLILMNGFSGSGKSTVAKRICEKISAICIRSDVERKRLSGLSPEEKSDGEIYSQSYFHLTYTQLLEHSKSVINAGFNCVVDATFLDRKSRRSFVNLAVSTRTPLQIVSCTTSDREIRRRLRLRNAMENDASEADVAVYLSQKDRQEKYDRNEQGFVIEVNTERDEEIISMLQQLSQ